MSRRVLALIRVILRPTGRYVLCWLAALALTGFIYHTGRHMFDAVPDPEHPETVRADSNNGHTFIDFGGQWLLARMVAAGRGHELYNRPAQRAELEAAYPRADEAPGAERSDAENLLAWSMDEPPDEEGGPRIGGALYPPTHALLFAPLGFLQPRYAYHLLQIVILALAWAAGGALARLSGGRLWWPAAASFLMLFPGFGGALHLGQNSMISLAILVFGWVLVARGREAAGGAVWGLLAYKPVWAGAFLLVPLFTRRWRMAAGMLGAGIVFGLLTLPIVGVQSWLQWLRIGRAAADLSKVDENWIFLSRDLLGVPRRWLLNFDEPAAQRDRLAVSLVGYGLWAAVVGGTAAVALVRRRSARMIAGYGAAFVGLGAWASCFHFIYYDQLLAALPVTLLLLDPQRFLRPTLLAATPAPVELAGYYAPRPLREPPPGPVAVRAGPRSVAVLNSAVLTLVTLLILMEQTFNGMAISATVSFGALPTGGEFPYAFPNPLKFSTQQRGTPWDLFVLLTLWAYCGVRVLMGTPVSDASQKRGELNEFGERRADVGGAHQ